MRNSTLAKFTLLPLSKIYGAVMAVRNLCFNYNILKSHSFDIPVICIGNIAVGGTGKTPHTEYVVNALRDEFNIGVLSRGYKRRTKGFVAATPQSTPSDIGDEPYQIYHKFGRKVTVCVCEDRVVGIRRMLKDDPSLNMIVLDDAFQHRYVKPDISIVLTEYSKPIFKDKLLPYGRLRESPSNISRADIVVVTKCPEQIKPIDFKIFEKDLGLIPEQGLFFSHYVYEHPRAVFGGQSIRLNELTTNDSILAVTGIAKPKAFVRYIKSFDAKVTTSSFDDHHNYTRHDLETIAEKYRAMPGARKYILTTEKDAVRLFNNPYFPKALKAALFYIPIHVEFIRSSSGNSNSLHDEVLRLMRLKGLTKTIR